MTGEEAGGAEAEGLRPEHGGPLSVGLGPSPGTRGLHALALFCTRLSVGRVIQLGVFYAVAASCDEPCLTVRTGLRNLPARRLIA